MDCRKHTEKSDKELVALSLKDQSYYLCLIKRYEGKLLKYIFRISSFSKEDAEDILQEVFIKAYQNLNDFDPEFKFSSWIYRITHNQTISHFRKAKARPDVVNFDINNESFANLIADGLDIEKEFDKKYLLKSVKDALLLLDEKYREVLVLKFLEEKDYNEIAYILRKPMGTVATLINRAKKKLKDEIRKNNIKF